MLMSASSTWQAGKIISSADACMWAGDSGWMTSPKKLNVRTNKFSYNLHKKAFVQIPGTLNVTEWSATRPGSISNISSWIPCTSTKNTLSVAPSCRASVISCTKCHPRWSAEGLRTIRLWVLARSPRDNLNIGITVRRILTICLVLAKDEVHNATVRYVACKKTDKNTEELVSNTPA